MSNKFCIALILFSTLAVAHAAGDPVKKTRVEVCREAASDPNKMAGISAIIFSTCMDSQADVEKIEACEKAAFDFNGISAILLDQCLSSKADVATILECIPVAHGSAIILDSCLGN